MNSKVNILDQKVLFDEIKGRIKLDDESLPYKDHTYEYWTKTTTEGNYSIKLRKKINSDKIEEICGQYKNLSENDLKILCWDDLKKVVQETLDEFTEPYFRAILLHNPAKELMKIDIPFLAIHGANDQLVNIQNLYEIRRIMKNTGNKDFSSHEFKNLNHRFQKCKNDQPFESRKCEDSFNENAMHYLTKWILDKSL